MLNDIEIEQWYQRLNLSDEACALIHQIRTSQPSRAVQSYNGNVTVRFPSRKMGVIIQAESHKVELAFIHEYENRDDVLEYLEQPPPIKLNYEAANGRRLGVLHTPDFFILRTHSAGWEECKPETQLLKLAAKSPNRYFRDAEGTWRCPPGEAYAERHGLYYHLRSSKEINWSFQRNVEFLEDYFRNDSQVVAARIHAFLLEQVTTTPGIKLVELFERAKDHATRDDVFMLVATGELYVDFHDVPLTESERVRVFPDKGTALAYKNLVQASVQSSSSSPHYVELTSGAPVRWGDKIWEIASVSETVIGLVRAGQSFVEMPRSAFEKLVRDSRITGVSLQEQQETHPVTKQLLEQADRDAFAKANHRYELVRAYINGDSLSPDGEVSERTLRRLASKFRMFQEAYGNGYVGLLPRKRKGNERDKLPPATRTLINEFIDNDYETIKQKRKFEVYAAFQLACERRGMLPASYKTFWKAIKLRPRYKQVEKRQGSKAAYKYKEFYWELTPTTPRHGERPFHIVHIDHTELDIELVCSETGQNLGRPWVTFLTDAYSRRLLAVSLTYDKPSYRSCMMVLRELVRRFSRFPQIIVVDGGKEFSCIYFETLLARYECTKKTRPPAQSRFGSVCERLFGTTNTRFIYNLQGNTQITRNVRQVTKAVNPKEHALWTLEAIYLYMREWAYEVYDTIEHPALGQSPQDAFARGMVRAGERKHRLIPYDDEFRFLTSPTTKKMTAKVIPGQGVKINYIYYWSAAFRHPEVEGTRVNVRYDPFNASIAFAYVRGQWVECLSERPQSFLDRSEHELMIAAKELRRRQTRHSGLFNITATKLAHFLESVESEEVLLLQRLRDRATKHALASANDDMQSQPLELVDQVAFSSANVSRDVEQSTVPAIKKPQKPRNLKMYKEF